MQRYFIILLIILVTLPACRDEKPSVQQNQAVIPVAPVETAAVPGCMGCHDNVVLAAPHDLECTVCHKGDTTSSEKHISHQGLIARPAHPDHMAQICGECHQTQVRQAPQSLHFTLSNKVNLVRRHFGAASDLGSLLEVPVHDEITAPVDLADDLLRKRCLRCHPYSSGDAYPLVRHGTGCAACHLRFEQGKLLSHTFRTPGTDNCNSCHYGNYVGSDFQGRFENDLNWEYRTPYVTRNTYERPYGVESLNLSRDIHLQRGLVCLDCHGQVGHEKENTIRCITCHGRQPDDQLPPVAGVSREGRRLTLLSKTGESHTIPMMKHPAHTQYNSRVACQVCHGQWAFKDAPTHLLRSASDDMDMWERLTVQGSSEIEALLENNLFTYNDELEPNMRDGITGESSPGVWYKGFGQRRWEDMYIARDSDGMIQVFRPILDLHLSMVDEDDNVLFDNIRGMDSGYRAYTPHTTGPAGLFYLNRFSHLLEKDTVSSPRHRQQQHP